MTNTLAERARRYATKAHAAIDQRRKYSRPCPTIARERRWRSFGRAARRES